MTAEFLVITAELAYHTQLTIYLNVHYETALKGGWHSKELSKNYFIFL